MRTSKFSETQIVSILKEADAGVKVKDICGKYKYGISDATYYNWNHKRVYRPGIQANELASTPSRQTTPAQANISAAVRAQAA